MANKKASTKSTVNDAAVETPTAADIETVEKNKEEVVEKKTKKETKKVVVEPLEDYDEIEVMSLIPNISYKDSKTGDFYEWDEINHIEYMTFDTLKNMWRNHKGYFRNLWLKPMDDRVIQKFGLTKTFEKYEFLMDETNYTKENIKDICSAISDTPNGLKFTICNKVKNLVINGEISDVSVVKELERHLGLELISLL